MAQTWAKYENENGYFYYYDEKTKMKQWDHPKFFEIKQRLDDCNYIKYSTYRVASKFRVLQQALYMEEVPLNVIAGVFKRHQLGANESSLGLETCDLEAILSDIYFAANKQNHTNTDVDFATELMINFLYNVFDKDRISKIQVLSTKLVLAVLSSYKLPELYSYIFNLCSDHNNCITRLRLQGVLSKFAFITNFMHEDSTFGQHLINSSIEECFSNSPGLVGINESSFMGWIESGPQFLSWMPILHRFKLSESILHSAKCSICKTTPLLGLRYRCIKCSRYTQCQRCFLTARISHNHKLSHSMREYCTEANSREFTYGLIKKLCGLLRCSVKYTQNNFSLDANETKPLSTDKNWLFNTATNREDEIKLQSSPQEQLQTIIRQLEQQNRELQQVLNLNCNNDKQIKQYLKEHQLNIAAQVHKLKILKDYLRISQPATVTGQFQNVESTPMVVGSNKNIRNVGLDMLSPIYQESSDLSEVQSNYDETACTNNVTKNIIEDASSVSYSLKDMSTWIGGYPMASSLNVVAETPKKSPVTAMHNDLDDALAKLQQILANNFTLDESLGSIDNGQLKNAVTEVEGMLTSLIDSVESSRASSVQPRCLIGNQETD